MKKLLWTALVALGSAAAAAATTRLLDRLWRRVAKEPPPEMPGWARLLIGKPLRSRVQDRIHPETL